MAVEEKKKIVGGLVNKKPASQLKEQKREDNAWKNKLFGYLEGYKKSFESLTSGKKVKGEGLFGKLFGGLKGLFGGGLSGLMTKILGMIGLTGIFTKVAGLGLGAAILPAAIILWGLTSVFKIVQKWSEGFKVDGFAGGFSSALGNKAEGGAMSALGGALTWAGIGATAGMAFGPLGMLVGGLIGAAIGGFFGWLGSDKIKKGIKSVQDFFGFPDLMTEDEKVAHQKKIDDIAVKIKALKSEVIPAIEAEIQVYTDMQAKGKELTLKEMIALDKLYQQKLEAEQAIIDGQKEMATLQRDLERQKLANLNQQKSELKDTKFKLTQQFTEVGDTGRMVHGEIFALQEEIRILDKDIKVAEKKGLTTEVESLKNKKRIAQAQLKLKQDLKVKVDEALDKTADEIFAEQQRLKDLDMLTWWESTTFGVKKFGRDFKEGWGFLMSDLGAMAVSVGRWIYTPGGRETGPPGTGTLSKAKMFGVTLEWPSWIKSVGATLTEAWDSTMDWLAQLPRSIGAWLYTPGGRETGPPGTGALTGATILGVQLPPLPVIGDALSEAWNKLTNWVKNLGLWFWNKEQNTMFGNFKIPTIEIPSIEWDAIVQGLMGKVASMIGKIPFIDRVPGMSGFLKKWGVDDRPSGPTQADVMPDEVHTPMSVEGTQQLKTHEGFSEESYKDTKEIDTIGYGFNLEKEGAERLLKAAGIEATVAELRDKKKTITEAEAAALMKTDIETAMVDAKHFVGPMWYRKLPQEMKDVLINMAYNLGANRLGGFTDLREALRKKNVDYEAVSMAMMDSKWATQVKGRATDLSSIAEAIGNSQPHMRTDFGLMLKAHPSAMGALLRGFGGGGGGTTTVNNVTVAPQTSTSVASTNIAENVYGTVDPYTNASGAYG